MSNITKIYRSRAPLRIGLAGGGTDVSPYSDIYGGAVLNATISLFAYANIELTDNGLTTFDAKDFGVIEQYALADTIKAGGKLNLLKGVYQRIAKDYPFDHNGFTLTTFVDCPPGSGLGSSSTLVVAIIGAFVEMLNLPISEYDIAKYAYDIERIDLGLAGGKQDQYAATFGGFNYMEFFKDARTVVNPLRIKSKYVREMENNILLYYTDSSRESANIIEQQVANVHSKNEKSIDAMHQLKSQALLMKEAILTGDLNKIGEICDFGFMQKRKMADKISNPYLDDIYEHAKKAGASGGKISGAGGGGFMMLYCPGNSRFEVIEALSAFPGKFIQFTFTRNGVSHWTTTTK